MKRIALCLAIVLTFLQPGSVLSAVASASAPSGLTGAGTADNPYVITSAENFPNAIPADTVYALGKDITLDSQQQILEMAGTLDGKGHTIKLADTPLAGTVSGTIQNLGVIADSGTVLNDTETFGSMAVTLSGTIQNCYSTVDVNISGWTDIGGLVGYLNGGSIRNSYYGGSSSAPFASGLVGVSNGSGGVLANSYFTIGFDGNGYGSYTSSDNVPTSVNCGKKTVAELKEEGILDLLNQDIVQTGFYWAGDGDKVNSGFPVLKAGVLYGDAADKTKLEEEIARARALIQEDYTEESWQELQTALEAAEKIAAQEEVTKAEVDNALATLTAAIAGLKKNLPSVPVAPPEEGITYISSQADLEGISVSDPKGFYVLQKDITIDSAYMSFGEFLGTLDGQGHTITFQDSWELFASVGATGVIQNVHFTGNISSFQSVGPLGTEVKGAVINCYSQVTGDNTCGFTKRLSGGLLANCYSVSQGKQGVVIKTYDSGKLLHTYWEKGLAEGEIPAQAMTDSGAREASYMQSPEFTALLNENRGEYGNKWGQSSTGYPYFGEDQSYVPPASDAPVNKYKVIFTPVEGDPIQPEGQELTISPDSGDAFGKVGQMSLSGIPETSRIVWSCSDVAPEKMIMIGEDSGDLYIYGEAAGVITATEIKADNTAELAATIMVTAASRQIEELKLLIDGEDVTNGTCTVAGSSWTDIQVQARYHNSQEFVAVPSSRFTYTIEDEELIYGSSDSSSFYFRKPGTGRITVASQGNPEIQAQVQVTSSYVAVEAVKPAISGTVTLHGRNPNSSSGKDFLPDRSAVIVTPANASYRENYQITSSNPEIGAYVPSMVKGYVPYKAGKTTYTAAIQDIDPATGAARTVSGSEEVTYVYQNPLSQVTAEHSGIVVENNTETPLALDFVGKSSSEGYSVTETGLVWSYDKEGIVVIDRKTESYLKQEEAPDKGYYVAGTDYMIYARSEGTVTAVGTPVDTSGGARPVTITITVVPGNASPADTQGLSEQGIQGALKFILEDQSDTYVYGQEWVVYSFLQSGQTLTPEQRQAYYDSVLKEIQGWTELQKPTDMERVALALEAMGENIQDLNGIDLAAMIYDHPELASGSNELAYALLALDAVNIEIPQTAKWSREDMITALLEFQTANGGFGLGDGETDGIDVTAMALQALARYKDQDDRVAASIEKALSYLKSEMTPDYGFEGSVESTAQVLLAVVALGIDPTQADSGFGTPYANLITNLMQYYSEEPAGFMHKQGEQPSVMPSLQALQALEAYQRYCNGEKGYWDLTDAKNPSGHVTPTPAATPENSPAPSLVPTQPAETMAPGASQAPVPEQTPSVKLNVKKGRLQVGETTSVLKVIKKEKGDKIVRWKTSNKKVATVSQKGQITAKKPGKAVITVVMKSGAQAGCKITVQKKPVKSTVSFQKKIYQVKAGASVKVKLKLSNPFDVVKYFVSSDKKIVKVSKTGVIKGIRKGRTTITVQTRHGGKASAKVQVNR